MDELSALDALADDFVAPAQSVPKVGLLLDSYLCYYCSQSSISCICFHSKDDFSILLYSCRFLRVLLNLSRQALHKDHRQMRYCKYWTKIYSQKSQIHDNGHIKHIRSIHCVLILEPMFIFLDPTDF